MALSLDRLAVPVTTLKGVSDARQKSLGAVGVETVLDLLTYYPRRYLDRTKEASVRDLAVGEEAMVLVTVKRAHSVQARSRRRFVTVDVSDGSGSLNLTFFNQPWREKQLRPGMQVIVF